MISTKSKVLCVSARDGHAPELLQCGEGHSQAGKSLAQLLPSQQGGRVLAWDGEVT